jgi:replicative DNA helicase
MKTTNLEYERSLAAQVLRDPRTLEVGVFPELFADDRIRAIVVTVEALRKEAAKITVDMVADRLKGSDVFDLAFLLEVQAAGAGEPAFYVKELSALYRKRATAAAVTEAGDLVREDRHGEALELMNRAAVDLSSRRPVRKPFAEQLVEKKTRDAGRQVGDLLGPGLKCFAELSRMIDGVQPGLYIFGAMTNVGKTAVLSNLALDVLAANPDVSVVFVSADDSAEAIVNRFLAILSGLQINQLRRHVEGQAAADLAAAYSTLEGYADAGRLDVRDDLESMDQLETYVRGRIFDPDNPRLVVFVDALYNLDAGKEAPTLREANIERANQLKRLVTTFKIPVLTTAELKKRDTDSAELPKLSDLMESGKYLYNADLVVLLSPEGSGTGFRNAATPVLILDFAKNKLSPFRGEMKATFDRATARVILANDRR